MKHSHQPMIMVDGVQRFQANAIVRYLLDQGPFDMNHLAMQGFDAEDEAHFAQLIGYSVSGWGDLSYVSDDMWSEAQAAQDARTKLLEGIARQRVLEEIDNSIAALGELRAALSGEDDEGDRP